jgi:hypothetical protein
VGAMICPLCRRKLPARFALATAHSVLECTGCHAPLRPTQSSLKVVRRIALGPSAKSGVILGFAGVWYGLATNRWLPLMVALALATIVSFAVSWWAATKRIDFERA